MHLGGVSGARERLRALAPPLAPALTFLIISVSHGVCFDKSHGTVTRRDA